MSELRCVVVTPEQTELDVHAESVTVPMYDGELGILKGHSPLVGRLGFGVLRIKSAAGEQEYFLEGGFVQVADDVVSVLTDHLTPMSEITPEIASRAMQSALEMPTDQPDLVSTRTRSLERARVLTRIAKVPI